MTTGISGEGYEPIFENGWIHRKGTGLSVRLETPDLELCSISEKDKPYYQSLYTDPKTMRLFTDNEAFIKEHGVEKWKERQMESVAKRIDVWVTERWNNGNPFSAFVIRHKRTEEPVGHIISGMGDEAGETELAFIIHEKHWNKGFASQAVDMMLQKWLPYLKEQGYKTTNDTTGESKVVSVVVSTARLDNTWSTRILEKRQFTKVGEKEAWGSTRAVYQKNL
jgi:ribosomal-protein-alanine N-acetyltransferase